MSRIFNIAAGSRLEVAAQRGEPDGEPAALEVADPVVALAAAQSKVAHHSTNARSPSVTGVTRSVAR